MTPGSFYTSRVNSTSLDRIVNIEHSSSSSFIRGSDLSSDKTQSVGTSRIAARTSLSLVPLGSAHLLNSTSPSMAGTEEEEELAYLPWPTEDYKTSPNQCLDPHTRCANENGDLQFSSRQVERSNIKGRIE